MQLPEAIAKAAQILDEERTQPTMSYEANPTEFPGDLGPLTAVGAEWRNSL